MLSIQICCDVEKEEVTPNSHSKHPVRIVCAGPCGKRSIPSHANTVLSGGSIGSQERCKIV